MKLADVDFRKLLPQFMREDKFNMLFAEASNNFWRDKSSTMEKMSVIDHIEDLNEAELDQLAKDSDIFWYMQSADIETKRQVIKEAPLVFNRLGTVWAVEKVMNNYLAGSELIEWFDSEDIPNGYFRFQTEDTSILKSDIKTFLSILEKVKRKSQWLDSIILQLKAVGRVYPAFGLIDRTIETYYFLTEDAVVTTGEE